MAQFSYGAALKSGEIRILELEYSEAGTDLKGRLHTRRIDSDHERVGHHGTGRLLVDRPEGTAPNAEEFEALSYTWGFGLAYKRIMLALDGDTVYKSFAIKENLEKALLNLRSRAHGPRYLWADAICINQLDNKEKSIQIPAIWKVYGHAKSVCVWLGEATDTSRKALPFIKTILKLDDFDDLVDTRERSNDWEAFCGLLKDRWFGRRWIVQEIALAQKARIYCGEDEEDWDTFADAVSLVSSRPENLRKLFKTSSDHNHNPNLLGELQKLGACWLASTIQSLSRNEGPQREFMFSLEELMSNLTLFEASDPRDYLYAILWLASDVSLEGSPLTHPSVDHSRTGTPVGERPMDVLGTEYSDQTDALDLLRRRSTTPDDWQISKNWRGPSRRASSHIPVLDNTAPYDIAPARRESYSRNPQSRSRRSSVAKELQVVVPSIEEPDNRRSRSPPREIAKIADSQAPRYRNSSFLAPEAPAYAQPIGRGVEMVQAVEADSIKHTDTSLKIGIDYEKSVYDVCKDFLHHVFSRRGYIDMMCRPWAPDPSEKHPWDPPSWMMTLKNNVAFQLNLARIYCRTGPDPLVGAPHMKILRSYNASGPRRAFERMRTKDDAICYPPKFGSKGNLFVKGFILAEIKHVRPAAKNGIVPISWLRFAGWDPTQGGSPPPHFWRTLVGDRGLDETSRPPRNFRMACKWAFEQGDGKVDLDSEKMLKNEKCPSHVAEFLTRMQRVVWNRCMILARCPIAFDDDKLFFGLAPHNVRAGDNVKSGDKICILYGCSVPVILREECAKDLGEVEEEISFHTPQYAKSTTSPKKNGFPVGADEKWYKFVGESYVHEFMNGQVFHHMEHRSKAKDSIGEMEFELR